MAAPVIYFRGGEDSEFFSVGICSVITTAGHFIATLARCALRVTTNNLGGQAAYWQNQAPFSLGSFWHSSKLFSSSGGTNISTVLLAYKSADGVVRLRLTSVSNGVFKIEKVSAAAVVTQLGSNFAYFPNTSVPDKLDVNIVYAVSGTFNIYLNGQPLVAFSGDVTTDSITALASLCLGTNTNSGAGTTTTDWSEAIVSDSDTRSMSLQTLPPIANGNTHNFDTGTPAAANVNETTLNDTTLDGSTTAGQIDEYTIGAIASGTFSIVDFTVSARAQKGSSGPSKIDTVVRVGSTDYFSADQALTTAFANYQPSFATDPSTGLAWAALPSQIGLKSVT